MKTELFGDRGKLSLGSVFSQYLSDLGSKFLYGINLGLVLNVSGIIFFSHTSNLAARRTICQKNVAVYAKIYVNDKIMALVYRLCPDAVFIRSRFDMYRAVSAQIREIFCEYTDLVEPLSLDEAFLDVTENYMGMTSATLIAREIKQKIYQRTGGLTSSAGVSFNKFLAQVASDINKPDGITVITPDMADKFIDRLPNAKDTRIDFKLW